MMAFSTKLLATLSILIYNTRSLTRHFIGEYITAASRNTIAFPVDMCLNHGVDGIQQQYGIFACNVTGDEVTFKDYGSSSDCSTTPTTTLYNTSTAAGALYSFSCTGTDDYVSINSCTASAAATQPTVGDDGGIRCCAAQAVAAGDTNAGCMGQLQATNVCVDQDEAPLLATMATCNNVSAVTNGFDASGCATMLPLATGGVVVSSDIDICGFYDNIASVYDVYRKMTECYVDGALISVEDDYCPFETDDPTQSPTGNPVTPASPTQSPEAAAGDAVVYFVKNVFILVVGVVVYAF